MLDIRLEIGKIDYRKCMEALLPPLVEHCAAKNQPNELDSFLAKLGANAVPAACAVLEKMDTDEKDQLVIWLITAHEERLRNAANRHLSQLLGAPLIRIGRFLAQDRPGTKMALLASRVEIDYTGLLNSSIVTDTIERLGDDSGILKGVAKLALQMGSFMSPESLEKKGIALLNTGRVKDKLMNTLTNALRQAGLDIEVEDLVAEASTDAQLPEAWDVSAGIPTALEKIILDILAAQTGE